MTPCWTAALAGCGVEAFTGFSAGVRRLLVDAVVVDAFVDALEARVPPAFCRRVFDRLAAVLEVAREFARDVAREPACGAIFDLTWWLEIFAWVLGDVAVAGGCRLIGSCALTRVLDPTPCGPWALADSGPTNTTANKILKTLDLNPNH